MSPSHARQQHHVHVHASPGRAFTDRENSGRQKRGSVSSDSDDSNSDKFKLSGHVAAGHFGHGCLDARSDRWMPHEDRHVSWSDGCATENAVSYETSCVYVGHVGFGTSSTERCEQQHAASSGHCDIRVCGASFGDGGNDAPRDTSPHVRSSSTSPQQQSQTRRDRSSHVVRVHTERHTVRYVQEGSARPPSPPPSPSPSPARVAPRLADKRDVEMAEIRASSRRTGTSAAVLSVTDAPERERRHSVGPVQADDVAASEGTPLLRSNSKNRSSQGQGGEGGGAGGGGGDDESSSNMDHIMESLHGDAGSLSACNCQLLRSVSQWSAGSAMEASIEQV